MRVKHLEQIVDLVIVNLHALRVAFVLHVGGADNRELVHPRDNKHNTVIFILQNVRLLLGMHARHHNVAAFDQADTVRGFQLQAVIKQLLHPRAGGIHQAFCLPGEGFASVDIFSFHFPQAVFTPCARHASAGTDFAAALFNFLGVEHHQACIIYPAVGIFESAHDFRF